MRILIFSLLLMLGCGDDSEGRDAGADVGTDGGFDAGDDAAFDAGRDAALPIDASFDRPDVDVRHPLDDVLRLNHLQAEGTHNSYHVRPSEMTIDDWSYTHAPLDVQLESQGVRQFELDLYFDEDERRWTVLHIPVIDEETNCGYLLECLATIRRWSDANPGHHPIFVQLEPKDFFDEATNDDVMGVMEDEIRTVFPEELIVTPGLVRGSASNVRDAVTMGDWPTLGEVRGRILFFLNCGREWCVHYANRGAGLDGKLIFVDGNLDDPWAAVVLRNGGGMPAREAVEAGRIVRTRAAGIVDALNLSTAELEAQRDAALATGAQMVSSDVPTPREDIDFFLEIPGGTPSRCNPLTAPAECTSEAIEDPTLLTGR